MSKSKRKIYAPQRDKDAIAIAKKLKKEGILSKQAKLHGGKYISKEVLAKVREYQAAARLNYTTVKVDRKTAKAAKARGYQVVQGNRIIGPKSPRFRNRLKSGKLTGVKPVKGGYMEEVTLPQSIYDMQSLIENDELNTLKLEEEYFAFQYRGNESYRVFADNQLMIDYILGYKGVQAALEKRKPKELQDEFANFTIMRLHPDDVSRAIPTVEQRRKRNAAKRAEEMRKTGAVRKGKTWAQRMEELSPKEAERRRAAKRKSRAKYVAKQKKKG